MSLDPKQRFLDDVFFSNTIQGAFQRVKVYPPEWTETQKAELRANVKRILNTLKTDYSANRVSNLKHLENIEHLSKTVGLRFGICQKLLNLFLKYYWCAGLADTPPHCPVDRIILNRLGIYQVRWPLMDRAKYEEVVLRLKEVSVEEGYTNIADWELEAFNTAISDRSKVFQCKCDNANCAKCLVVNCKDDDCTIHTLERKLAQRKLRGLPTG